MKPLITFLFTLTLSSTLFAQDSLDLVGQALQQYQAKNLLQARLHIELALSDDAYTSLPKTHYFRGYIYKDLYRQNRSDVHADSFRIAAIRAFKQVIFLEKEVATKELTQDAIASLNYLSSTLYNDAMFAIDAKNVDRGQNYFSHYVNIQRALKLDISHRIKAFNAYVATKKEEDSPAAAVSFEARQNARQTIESLSNIEAESNELATIDERFLYLNAIIEQSDGSKPLKLSKTDLIELNYRFGKLCIELFRIYAATDNPYPYYQKGLNAIDRAIALDTEFEYPKLAILRKRLEKLKLIVDRQQAEVESDQTAKKIIKNEAFEALDAATKAMRYYRTNELLKAQFYIEIALQNDTLNKLAKTSYFAGYIYKDLFKQHQLDEMGHPYRLRAVDAFFCAMETEGSEALHEDIKINLNYLASTIYNDAAYALDTSNFSIGQSNFALYKLIISRINPELDLTKRDAEFKLYLASKYTERLDTLPKWDTLTAEIISEIYEGVLQQNPKNTSARYNGYEHAVKSQKFKSQLLAEVRRDYALRKAQSQRQRTQLIAMGGGLLMVLLLAGISFRAYRQKQRANELIAAQKEEVELQRELLEEKNKEITDSITYAKRIQEAILPPMRMVMAHLPNSFILYKPKDIVAGDFYWLQPHGDWTIFAAADCTGHGVPGAMVSVVCSNALNRAVREFKLTEPANILDKTLELVIERFEQSEEDVKDGMDISLCALNIKTNELHWAGAQNPLWLVTQRDIESLNRADERKLSAEGYTLYEIKANKQPIGKFQDPEPFTNHRLQLEPGDSIYIFSDGYPDQFGGPKGKKLKTKAFKSYLLSIQNQPIKDQHDLINAHFEVWKANLEQVDDVCVIGVRIERTSSALQSHDPEID